ncbi:MAG: hypothetical protein WDZ44_00750 [Candidatus Spechtbacterales bacterium]
MSQLILEKLFDSPAKLRLLKLFLRNPGETFSLADIRRRTMVETAAVKAQLQKLDDMHLVNSTKKRGQDTYLYAVNPSFIFYEELQNLILKSSPADEDKIATRIRNMGKVRLVVLSGIFMKPERENSRTDVLVVADAISERRFHNYIRQLEAEAGVEIQYTILTTEEYEYRTKMFDRFLRDILEKPHRIIVGKKKLATV